MEKAMATHSSTLAWRIPWMEDPGGPVHGVAKSRTRLSYLTFTFCFHALEKEMATHSSILACRLPGTEEPVKAAVYGVAQSRTRLTRLSSSSSRQPQQWPWIVHISQCSHTCIILLP